VSVTLVRVLRGFVTLTLTVFVGIMCYHVCWTYFYMVKADRALHRAAGYDHHTEQAKSDQARWEELNEIIKTKHGIPRKDPMLGIDENLNELRRLYAGNNDNLSIDELVQRLKKERLQRTEAMKDWADTLPEWDAALAPLAGPMERESNVYYALRRYYESRDVEIKAKDKELDDETMAFRPKKEGPTSLPVKLEQTREKISRAKKLINDEMAAYLPKPRPLIEEIARRKKKLIDLDVTLRELEKEPLSSVAEPDGVITEVGKPSQHFARISLGWSHRVRPAMQFIVWRYDNLPRRQEMGRVEITNLGPVTSECVVLPPHYKKPVCPQCGWVAPDAKMMVCPYCVNDRLGQGVHLTRDFGEVRLVEKREPGETIIPGDFLYNPFYLKKRPTYLFYIAEDTVVRSRTEIAEYIRENGGRVVPFDDPSYVHIRPDGSIDAKNLDNPNYQPGYSVDYIVLGLGLQSTLLRTKVAPKKGLKTISEAELYEYYGQPVVP